MLASFEIHRFDLVHHRLTTVNNLVVAERVLRKTYTAQ